MLSNDNVLVRFIASIALHNAQSPVGSKYVLYRHEYNINLEDRLSKNVQKVILHHSLDIEKQAVVSNLLTLQDILKFECDLPGFDNDQVQYIINDLLIN